MIRAFKSFAISDSDFPGTIRQGSVIFNHLFFPLINLRRENPKPRRRAARHADLADINRPACRDSSGSNRYAIRADDDITPGLPPAFEIAAVRLVPPKLWNIHPSNQSSLSIPPEAMRI